MDQKKKDSVGKTNVFILLTHISSIYFTFMFNSVWFTYGLQYIQNYSGPIIWFGS